MLARGSGALQALRADRRHESLEGFRYECLRYECLRYESFRYVARVTQRVTATPPLTKDSTRVAASE
jgi:hypothetical protein